MRRLLARLSAAPLLLASPAGASCPADIVGETGEPAARCRVEIEGVATAEGAGDVRYAFYGIGDIDDAAGAHSAVALFEPGETTPFWFGVLDLGLGKFERPIVVGSENGEGFLVVRATYSGTAALVSDRVFLLVKDGWRDLGWTLDTETGGGIVGDIAAAAPDGLGVWKGVRIDYARLDGETPLWRPGDANCCPSGGALKFRLELNPEKTALRLAGVEYAPPEEESAPRRP